MAHEIIALAIELKGRSLNLLRSAVEAFGGGRFATPPLPTKKILLELSANVGRIHDPKIMRPMRCQVRYRRIGRKSF